MRSGAAIAVTLSLVAIGTAGATALGLWRWATRYESLIHNQNNER
ncbi:hypothetical protein ACMTN4_07605 [Rhodococcus globerulus]